MAKQRFSALESRSVFDLIVYLFVHIDANLLIKIYNINFFE